MLFRVEKLVKFKMSQQNSFEERKNELLLSPDGMKVQKFMRTMCP